jgi:hypothetical protein
MVRTTTWTLAACAALLLACGDDSGGDSGAGAGAAGVPPAGTGGGIAGMGGTGGMVAGTGGTTGGTGGGMSFVPGSPTFTAVFEEVVKGQGCNAPVSCHGGLVGNLQMLEKQATYDALVNQPAMGMNLTLMPPHCIDSGLTRVVPGDPANSLLIQKLDGTQPCGDKMPPTFDLDATKIEQVRAWVQNGALND